MDIQVLERKSLGVERRLRISVSAAKVADTKERVARRVAREVRLPGFRPGKAPPDVVRKKFADAIQQEAIETLLREAYEAVLQEEKLDPVTQPHAHDVQVTDGALSFELHCEVRPTVELARVEGFRVRRPRTEVTEDMVRAQLERMREQRATWTPVEEKPRSGDLVTVQLAHGTADGTLGESKEYHLVLGAGQAIAGIEELVMELQPGGTVEQPVRWPDDFPDESQRGVTKAVRVVLVEVKRKSVPALDDTFAREMGDFETLAELTAAVRGDLAADVEREADSAVRAALIDDILSANTFDVPPTWVRQVVAAYAQAYRVPESETERFAREFRATAERQVRRDFVIDTIAEREKLKATEKDVDERVTELANRRGADAGQVYATLEKAGRLKEIERAITEDRVFAWLLARNTVEQN